MCRMDGNEEKIGNREQDKPHLTQNHEVNSGTEWGPGALGEQRLVRGHKREKRLGRGQQSKKQTCERGALEVREERVSRARASPAMSNAEDRQSKIT